jgi:hypothetical protein
MLQQKNKIKRSLQSNRLRLRLTGSHPRGPTNSRWPLVGARSPAVDRVPTGPSFCQPPPPSLLLLVPKFFGVSSTLPHWLQHMPALPRLLLKTSNTHNYWSVGPKNAIFFPWSLRQDECSQKASKILKIVWAQVTLTKTGLSAVRIFGPLGVKGKLQNLHKMNFILFRIQPWDLVWDC